MPEMGETWTCFSSQMLSQVSTQLKINTRHVALLVCDSSPVASNLSRNRYQLAHSTLLSIPVTETVLHFCIIDWLGCSSPSARSMQLVQIKCLCRTSHVKLSCLMKQVYSSKWFSDSKSRLMCCAGRSLGKGTSVMVLPFYIWACRAA